MRVRGPPAAARHRARPPEERSLTPLEPRFVGAFPRPDVSLDPPLPEVALVGRSNVGKSSLLNALAGRTLARVSGTPGKTRALNVYHMGDHYALDLPGYGYARASKTDRAAFRRLVAGALARPRVAGVLWLLDLRRDPSPEDLALQDLFAARGTRVLAALTKSDKLPRGERPLRELALCRALRLDAEQSILTSARTGDGIAELREAMGALVREATE